MNQSNAAGYEGIIVLGPPRSGTTLLRRLLDAHPKISCPPETNVFCGFARLMREDRFVGGATLGAVSGLAYAGLEPEGTIAKLRELAFDFHREIAKRQGKPVWASKTAADAFYVDPIERLCGDRSKFICLVRHGMDVVCSVQELCIKQEVYLPEFYDYIRQTPFPLEAFARMWCDLTVRVKKFADDHPDNALFLKYEDLAADGHAVMKRVFAFAGVDYDKSYLDGALERRENAGPGDFKSYRRTEIHTESIGRWRSLSPDSKSRLGTMMNPTLESLGYEPVAVVPEPSEEQARRQYQLGLLMQGMRRPLE